MTTYDANDRTIGDSWNANGNMLTRDGRTQGFDSLDRPTTSTSSSGPSVHVYYNGDGERLVVDVGGTLVSYLLDDKKPTGYAQVVEERVSGAVTKAYAFGHKALSQRSKSSASWVSNYYGLDGHGSVISLTDSTGVVTDTWEYDAFGTVIARTGTTANSILYSGSGSLRPRTRGVFKKRTCSTPSTCCTLFRTRIAISSADARPHPSAPSTAPCPSGCCRRRGKTYG